MSRPSLGYFRSAPRLFWKRDALPLYLISAVTSRCNARFGHGFNWGRADAVAGGGSHPAVHPQEPVFLHPRVLPQYDAPVQSPQIGWRWVRSAAMSRVAR